MLGVLHPLPIISPSSRSSYTKLNYLDRYCPKGSITVDLTLALESYNLLDREAKNANGVVKCHFTIKSPYYDLLQGLENQIRSAGAPILVSCNGGNNAGGMNDLDLDMGMNRFNAAHRRRLQPEARRM